MFILSKPVLHFTFFIKGFVCTFIGVRATDLLVGKIRVVQPVPCEAVVTVTTICLPIEIYGNKIAVISVLSFYGCLAFQFL